MRVRPWLLAIWTCFLIRGFFFAAVMPLWEGFDEWSHFAVVQRMVFRGEALVNRECQAPRDVAASMFLAPLAWELRKFGPPSLTHDEFWRLPAQERASKAAQFRAIPSAWKYQDSEGTLKTYEGLHPPLFGWSMAPLLWAAQNAHLSTQVLLLRWWSVLLVSLTIPFAFFACRAVFDSDRLALGCAAIIAAMPGLLVGAGHVANECVGVMLLTLVVGLSVETINRGLTTRRAVALGVALGLGLLAKAYVLTAVPVVGLLLLWKFRRDWRAYLVPLCTFTVAGWWYIRNLVTTGTVTATWEAQMLPQVTLLDELRQIPRIHWGVLIDSVLFSHIWLGSWSTLTVRSWIYHIFYLLIVLAAVGLVRQGIRTMTPAMGLMALFTLSFWAGQLYHAITLFMLWGLATTIGSYLYAVIAAETALTVAGLRGIGPPTVRRAVVPLSAALFALLDLYTMHLVSLPYYAGITAHRPGGAVPVFHFGSASFNQIAQRLHMFKSPLLEGGVLEFLWIAYLAATVALVAIAIACASDELRPAQRFWNRT